MSTELPIHLRHLDGTDNRGRKLVVVIPVCRPDWHLAVKLLKWIVAVQRPMQEMPPIIVYCAPAVSESERAELAKVSDQFTIVHATHFDDVGYFGGANNMIKGSLDYCEQNHPDRAMLFVEADAVPMSWDWIERISAEYRGCGQPFMGDVVICEIPHLTGNAIYHPNWRTIAPMLAALPGPDPEWGWDSMCASDTLTRAHRAATIQQIWRPPLPITAEWAAQNIRPDVALFHQVKDGSLIDVLCDREGINRIPLPAALCESTYLTQKRKPSLQPTRSAPSPEPPPRPPLPRAQTTLYAPRHKRYQYQEPKKFIR